MSEVMFIGIIGFGPQKILITLEKGDFNKKSVLMFMLLDDKSSICICEEKVSVDKYLDILRSTESDFLDNLRLTCLRIVGINWMRLPATIKVK